MVTNLGSFHSDDDVGLLVRQLELVGVADVLGLVCVGALHALLGQEGGQQRMVRERRVAPGQVAGLFQGVLSGGGVDAGLPIDLKRPVLHITPLT